MYISPVGCLFVGLCIGVLFTLVTIVGITIYVNHKKEKKNGK